MAYPRIPSKLPCGCRSMSHGSINTRNSVLILHDGTRVCKDHGRRFKLIFQEVKIGEEV